MSPGLTVEEDAHRERIGEATEGCPNPAPVGHALAFWICLGLLSTFFAEVVSSNEPLPFLTPGGLVVVVPIYTLHAVFLGGVLVQYAPRLTFPPLYLAGVLFGLYEGPLTKVLWAPPWESVPLTVGGIHVISFATLVLFWHPIVAFVLPMVLAERSVTRSRWVTDALPDGVRRRLRGQARWRILLAAVTAGAVIHGVLSPSPFLTVAGIVVGSGVVLGAITTFRRWIGPATYDVRSLLPRGRRLAAVGGAIALLYTVLFVGLRPEASPTVTETTTILVAYVLVVLLLAVAIRRGRNAPPSSDGTPISIPHRLLVGAVAWFLLVAVAVRITIAPLGPLVLLVLPITGVAIAAWVVGRLVRSPLAPR